VEFAQASLICHLSVILSEAKDLFFLSLSPAEIKDPEADSSSQGSSE